MKTTSVTIYSTGYRETRTYLAAALFAAGNIVLPQLCHLVQLGGPTMLPPSISAAIALKVFEI